MSEVKLRVSLSREAHENLKVHELCGYSNCFRPYFKHRGFMPTCKFHYEHPAKWGKDGLTYTGSIFRKSEVNV
jgi:hypothetical protein